MKRRWGLLLGLPLVVGAAAGQGPMRGVENPARARQNWILKCQGCHRADGSGSAGAVPPLGAMVGRIAAAPGGRDYLVRVPGVATAALPDAALAELLNWTLQRFGSSLPAGFVPYEAQEVGRLRATPLRTDAGRERARIVARLGR